MSTRANIYLCEEFVAEIRSDAYPLRKDDPYYEDSLWGLMERLDGCTSKEFREAVTNFVQDPDYLPPSSKGVGNWSYEYMWAPVEPAPNYRDWDNWKGRILVRKPDPQLMEEFDWAHQIPGPWTRLEDMVPVGRNSPVRPATKLTQVGE